MTRHARSMRPEELFWSKVNKDGPVSEFRPDLGPCWIWTGYIHDSGYGQVTQRRKPSPSGTNLPHRAAYELLVGPIPDGLWVDHLCRNRACVNALGHLEPVTPKVNTERGLHGELRTRCSKGHELTPENTYVRPSDNSRKCRICMRDEDLASHADPVRHQGRLAASRRWKAKRRAERANSRAKQNSLEGIGR